MLIVIALGGNALLQRGEPLEASHQRKNVKTTAQAIAKLAEDHQIVICHGNGPQVGLLALQNLAYTKIKPYPLDVLGAESQGMIGYFIQQEVSNLLTNKEIVTLLTQVLVDKNDPAFQKPTKFIGPVYEKEEAETLAKQNNWTIAADGKYYRRVVPSPQPQGIVELPIIKTLLEDNHIVIAGGGGGIPVIKEGNKLTGIEAVIDKDNTASRLAEKLNADMLLILTDVSAACINWGTPEQKEIKSASPEQLAELSFPAGSMGPKISACIRFAKDTGKKAAIGNLHEIEKILAGETGTQIQSNNKALTYY